MTTNIPPQAQVKLPRKIHPSAAEVPPLLREHYQFEGDFCAVSGFESIAKLEGLIGPYAFPLQENPANLSKGFQSDHRVFLDQKGLEAKDEHFNTGAEAAAVIIRETDAGRFPLVSLPVQNSVTKKWGYHVFAFAKYQGKLLLIDPAVPQVMLKGHEDLARALDAARNNGHPFPHKTVHMLSYIRRDRVNAKPLGQSD